jgi:hypothetical protein
MKTDSKKELCNVCCNTGLAKATLVNKEVDGKLFHDHIDLILCGQHFQEGEETIASFELPTQVVGVVQPTES